jgi:hypothetical protein
MGLELQPERRSMHGRKKSRVNFDRNIRAFETGDQAGDLLDCHSLDRENSHEVVRGQPALLLAQLQQPIKICRGSHEAPH